LWNDGVLGWTPAATGNGRAVARDPEAPGTGARLVSHLHVDYEKENDRIIVARHEGKEVARIVMVAGGGMSFRMEDGSRRGGPVKDVAEAKKQIERCLR
jgi:hypothetical protein